MDKTISTSSKYKFIGNYRYDPDQLLGSGFESEVYRAQHRLRKHEVALKVVDVQKLGEGINQKLFESQLRCLEQLKSTPHVLNLHQVIRTEEKIYVVTELCSGDLNNRPNKKLPKEQAWAYLQQAIKGYRYLYEKQIVHRDLKPGNLFFNIKKQIKIGDFGFAGKLSEVRKQNYYNIGSPGYMAPEVVARNQYSFATDIWSIGVIFYELLTGKLPWSATTEDKISKQMNQSYLKRSLIRPEIDLNSRKFLQKVLCFNEFDRMKPEELFEYQLDPLDDQDLEEPNISLNGNKLYKFDQLSKTTAENTQKNLKNNFSKKNGQTIQNFLNEFSPPKNQLKKKISLKVMIPLNSTKNQSLHPFLGSQPPKTSTNRRNSFHIQLQGGSVLPMNTLKTSSHPSQFQRFKKKRASFDASEIFPKVASEEMSHEVKIKKSKKIKLENFVLAELDLLEKLLIFFKNTDLIGNSDRWDSEVHIMKVCLKNVMANMIENNSKKAEYYNTIVGYLETKKYINSEDFDKHQKIFKKYESEFKSDPELAKYSSKVKKQNINGTINVILSFLAVLKPCLMDSRKYGLQIAVAASEIVEKMSAVQHPENLESFEREESIFMSSRTLKRSYAFQRIEQAMLLKPAF